MGKDARRRRADGYDARVVSMDAAMSSWMIGNIFTGLVPGLIVDSISGGDNVFPDKIIVVLHPKN